MTISMSEHPSLKCFPLLSTISDFFDKVDKAKGCINKEFFLKKYISWRWRVAYIALSGLVLQIVHRNCISLALICMTKSNSGILQRLNESKLNISKNRINDLLDIQEPYRIKWDSLTQGLVLSSYFYGQIVSPLLSGLVCRKFGVRWPMTVYTLTSSVTLMLIPAASEISATAVIVLRIIQGFLGSGCLPMFAHLWTQWAPVHERSQLISFTFSGLDLGVIIAFTSSGWLCSIPVQNGWPFIFYTFGAVSFIWMIIWCTFVTDTPKCHAWISEKEKQYILGDNIESKSITDSSKKIEVPWLSILTSGPVWAMTTAMFTVAWGMTVVFSYLPRYMNDVLDFNIHKNGILSSLPFAGKTISVIVIGVITDKLIKEKLLKITHIRKINQCTALFIGAAAIIPVGFTDSSSRWLAIILFVISNTALGGTMSGAYPNLLDLAPGYAASISGMAFTLNGIGQLSAPIFTSWMTQNGSREEWRLVFCTVGGIYLIGGIVYAVLGSGEIQAWDNSLSVVLDSYKEPDPTDLHIKEDETYQYKIKNNMTVEDFIKCTVFDNAEKLGLQNPDIIDNVGVNIGIKKGSREEWRLVFCTVGGIYLIGGIVYAVLGSGEIQAWDNSLSVVLDSYKVLDPHKRR